MSLTLERLDALHKWATAEFIFTDIEQERKARAELIEYARERAAREACEAALPKPDESIIEVQNMPGSPPETLYCAHAYDHLGETYEGDGRTVTAAYLALLAKLEAA